MDPKVFYLFARRAGANGGVTEAVFYMTEGQQVAEGLCGLFKREYGANDGTEFRCVEADSISAEEQVLLDESLRWLEVYDDPDPGIYDPAPSPEMMTLAQYGVRARAWEELLRGKTQRTEPRGQKERENNPNSAEPLAGAGVESMPEEERRNAMLGLLMLFAQAYYRTLEAAIGMASIVSSLDLELNHSYLWAVRNLRNLLANSPELSDFPEQFKPAVPNLYPSTIRDLDWEDGIGPEAEGFLSAVQDYVMEKGIYDPEEQSPAWCMIELFRPGVEKAVQRAAAYRQRMSAAWGKMWNGAAKEDSGEEVKAPMSQASAPEGATDGAGRPEAVTPASRILVRGRLRCSPGFEDIWIGNVHYDLRARKKARLCIQYLFENNALCAGSARHLEKEIDPFVRERGGYPPAVEIKIQHYFNSRKGKLPELCKQLIGGVQGKGRYFLKVE